MGGKKCEEANLNGGDLCILFRSVSGLCGGVSGKYGIYRSCFGKFRE